jgi:putative restriction endonuclease
MARSVIDNISCGVIGAPARSQRVHSCSSHMPVSFAQVPVGSRWSRPSLAQLWGYAAYQALARGVVTPAGDNKIILFVTEQKQSAATNYQDVLLEDVLRWEGPTDHFAEQRMLFAAKRGDETHLFHRPRHHMEFEYRGELKTISFELKANAPSKFVFEVLDPSRQDWTHDELLAAFYLYLQVKPSEMQSNFPAVVRLAKSLKKADRAVATKLRSFAQLDPVLSRSDTKASDNVTPLDKSIWDEFRTDWTRTTLRASEAFESVVGDYLLDEGVSQVSASDAQYLFQEGRTREAIVKVRQNQHVFRRAILTSYGATCCISGLKEERLLVASHIVPWAHDPQNRLNPENGLCLSALHDRAYDQGLITVLPDFTIRVAPDVKNGEADEFLSEALGRYDQKEIRLPGRFPPNGELLASHAKRFGYL